MKTTRFTPILWACAVLALMGGAVSTGVNANTITMNDYNGAGDTVSCVLGCEGFVGPFSLGPPITGGPISLSLTMADAYPQTQGPGGSSAANELIRLNQLLALFADPRDPVSYVNKVDGDGDSFTTSLQYFSIKKSTDLWFFENTSGGAVTVNLEGRTEDYSHWTEYGPPSVVPVPAAFWLFGTALIGFIGFSRRTKV